MIQVRGYAENISEAASKHQPIRVLAVVDIYKDELELIIDKVFENY